MHHCKPTAGLVLGTSVGAGLASTGSATQGPVGLGCSAGFSAGTAALSAPAPGGNILAMSDIAPLTFLGLTAFLGSAASAAAGALSAAAAGLPCIHP